MRNYQYGYGTHESIMSQRKVEPVDLIMKRAGFNIAANANVESRSSPSSSKSSSKRNFHSSFGSKVKPLSLEETIRLMSSQKGKRQPSYSSRNVIRKPLLAKELNSPDSKKKKKLSNATSLRVREYTHKPSQNRGNLKGFSPREKVLKVLHPFRAKFKELDRDKAARRGESNTATSRVDYETRKILMSEGVQVNTGKRIGPVPGIEVGDEFQYKSELNLIGLHFDMMGGIDYMIRGGSKVATSIVSSEGNHGYSDRFDYDVIIYSGQGGNVKGKEQRKVVEDQKLVTGNLALANSMREKKPVRVVRGKRRMDQRGKRYVYVGLYMVVDYWREREPEGQLVFKFKLRRVPGQPCIDH